MTPRCVRQDEQRQWRCESQGGHETYGRVAARMAGFQVRYALVTNR